MRLLVITLALFVATGPLQAQDADPDPIKTALGTMRRGGYQAATQIAAGIMVKAPKEHCPGTALWLGQMRKALAPLDLNKPPASWPALDLDALLYKNPAFWRMVFETYQGDPMLWTLVAGLQMAAGEGYHASDTLRMVIHSPNRPQVIRRTLAQVHGPIGNLLKLSQTRLRQGFPLHDKGDFEGAIKIYKEVLASWPQEGWAHFELGQSVRAQQMKKDPATAQLSNEHHAACRRHNPRMWKAWQGSGKVLEGLRGLKLKMLPAWAKMEQGKELPAAFGDIAAGAQQAELHSIAILARMLAADHQGKAGEGYHAFMAKSLRALAPGEAIEALLVDIQKPDRKLFSPARHERPVPPK